MKTMTVVLATLLAAPATDASGQPYRSEAPAQEGDLAGSPTIFIVWASNQPTRQLVRSRKEGPGRMKILVPHDSKLVELFRSAHATRSAVPIAHLDFMGITDHAEFARPRVVVQIRNLTVHEVAIDPSQPMASVSLTYTRITYCAATRC